MLGRNGAKPHPRCTTLGIELRTAEQATPGRDACNRETMGTDGLTGILQ